MSVISDRCTHVPTSPGQGVCTCLDEIMRLRLTVHCLSREVDRLQTALNSGTVTYPLLDSSESRQLPLP